jgi:ZIP family zinc transporter
MDVLILFLAATATALACGLGAIPVFFLGDRAIALRPYLWGLAVGVMTVAAIWGLLIPAFDEGTPMELGIGLAIGLIFLWIARRVLDNHHHDETSRFRLGKGRAATLTFAVLLVHSLPEGFAIGTAYASTTAGLGVFVISAIAIQNIPEGTSVAIPMAEEGYSRSALFWGAVLTSIPQPIGALIAYGLVDWIKPLLPISFAFAAGAMLALVATEMVPASLEDKRPAAAVVGTAIGAGIMLILSLVFGV